MRGRRRPGRTRREQLGAAEREGTGTDDQEGGDVRVDVRGGKEEAEDKKCCGRVGEQRGGQAIEAASPVYVSKIVASLRRLPFAS